MKTPILCLALFTALPACMPKLAWQWSTDPQLKALPRERADGAAAAYLLKERRILLVSNWRSPSYTQWQQHDVLAIHGEKGFSYANVRVPYRADAKFVAFAARTISPTGEISVVEPASIKDDVAREADGDDDDYKVRIFSFPDVKVGSVLEYQYTIEGPRVYTSLREYTNSELPVDRYVLELQGTKDLIFAAKAYNTDKQWTSSDEGDTWKLSWTMENIPATTEESFAPDRRLRDPWWVWVVRQFSKYNVVVDANTDWATTYKGLAKRFYFDHDEYYADFAPAVELAGCDATSVPKECRIDRVLGWLRREVPFRGFDDSSRNAKEIVAKGSAVSEEKVRLAFRLLANAGIRAELAFVNRNLEGLNDPGFPYYYGYNHQLLHVPKQDGLPRRLWIDPSCEHCTVGQVPSWSKGAEALIIHAEKPLLASTPEVKVETLKVDGEDPVPERLARITKLVLDASGRAKIHTTNEAHGREAQNLWNDKRTWTDEDYKKNAAEVAAGRITTAVVDGYTRVVKDDALQKASRSFELSAPGYATEDGGQLIVPLLALSPDYESTFGEEHRKLDIAVKHPEHRVESLVIEVPAGFVPSKLPAKEHVSTPCFELDLGAEVKGGTVEITRSIRFKPGLYDDQAHATLREGMKRWVALRKSNVVFAKQ